MKKGNLLQIQLITFLRKLELDNGLKHFVNRQILTKDWQVN